MNAQTSKTETYTKRIAFGLLLPDGSVTNQSRVDSSRTLQARNETIAALKAVADDFRADAEEIGVVGYKATVVTMTEEIVTSVGPWTPVDAE